MYIRPDAIILIPVLYFIGLFLRKTPYIPEWSHVWIQLMFAVIACNLYYGWEIQSVVQGILVTGAAEVSRGLIHQTINGMSGVKENSDKGKEKEKERDRPD
ncbi:holin [Bacillus sp. B15-48]|nr:phage holin family protein [Bacillus sp. B15-48]MBM4764987.1 holin [Bacillus sp. B15-48]